MTCIDRPALLIYTISAAVSVALLIFAAQLLKKLLRTTGGIR